MGSTDAAVLSRPPPTRSIANEDDDDNSDISYHSPQLADAADSEGLIRHCRRRSGEGTRIAIGGGVGSAWMWTSEVSCHGSEPIGNR